MKSKKELKSKKPTSLLKVVNEYEYALRILDEYDHQELKVRNVTKDNNEIRIDYQDAIEQINSIPYRGTSELFGKEKDKSFESALNAIYQSAFEKDMYPSIEEKAANLLYFVVKNHAFYDGNKRIAASVFLWFLDINGLLYKKDGTKIIENNALVAIVMMIVLSRPEDKEEIIKIVINLINQSN